MLFNTSISLNKIQNNVKNIKFLFLLIYLLIVIIFFINKIVSLI